MIYGQFKRLSELMQIKKKILNNYKINLSGLNIAFKGITNIILEFNEKYKIKINLLVKYLNSKKIHARRLPELFEPHKNSGKKNTSLLKNFYQNSIILPSNFNLNNQDIQFISSKIKYFLNKKN